MGIGGLGPIELLIIGMIALLLFGKRVPEVARSLGSSLKAFQKGLRSAHEGPEEIV